MRPRNSLRDKKNAFRDLRAFLKSGRFDSYQMSTTDVDGGQDLAFGEQTHVPIWVTMNMSQRIVRHPVHRPTPVTFIMSQPGGPLVGDSGND